MLHFIRKKLAFAAYLIVLLLPATSVAQTYELLDQQGDWKLYRADNAPMRVKGHEPDLYDGICIAQSTVEGITLQFVMLPPALHEIEEETGFVVSISVYSDAWNFKPREGYAALTVGSSSVSNTRARYSGDEISFDILESVPFGIFMMFAGVSEEIIVLNRKKKAIAAFPTTGFAEIRDKLFDCADF